MRWSQWFCLITLLALLLTANSYEYARDQTELDKSPLGQLKLDGPPVDTLPTENKSAIDKTQVSECNEADSIIMRPIRQIPDMPDILFCYICSSDVNGLCVQDLKDVVGENFKKCNASNEFNACYTVYHRPTGIVSRGCIAGLPQSLQEYCDKQEHFCDFCNRRMCNKERAPCVPLEYGGDCGCGGGEGGDRTSQPMIWVVWVLAVLRLA